MTKTQKEKDSSLLWDCFTNWSLTLQKTSKQKTKQKQE